MSTIDYYDQNAQEYYERTVDADLAEIREYFLGFLRRDARILDFGCGSGRDAKAFAEALGIGTATFWRWIREGRLPQGTRLSARCTVWPVTALEDFVRQQGASREA